MADDNNNFSNSSGWVAGYAVEIYSWGMLMNPQQQSPNKSYHYQKNAHQTHTTTSGNARPTYGAQRGDQFNTSASPSTSPGHTTTTYMSSSYGHPSTRQALQYSNEYTRQSSDTKSSTGSRNGCVRDSNRVRTFRKLSVTRSKTQPPIPSNVYAVPSMLDGTERLPMQQQMMPSQVYSEIRKVTGLEGRRVIQASIGSSHVALLTDDGEVFCYGEGKSGQLGLGKVARTATPTRVTSALDSVSVVHVTCGSQHTVAVTASGSLVTW